MADLLECLLQIKALHDSPARLRQLAGAAGPVRDPRRRAVREAAEALIAAEGRWQASLAAALGEAAGDTGGSGSTRPAPRDAVARFAGLREASLAVLDGCSARDFEAAAHIGGHGPGRVADLIAHMLAHDTERLGELRRVIRN